MRAAVRPLLLFVLLCGSAPAARPDDPTQDAGDPRLAPGNYAGWAANSPAPTTGGVTATVELKTAPGYTCTRVVIRVIDDATNDTLQTVTIDSPGAAATHPFTNLVSNLRVRVTAEASFTSNTMVDTQSVTATVTTQ